MEELKAKNDEQRIKVLSLNLFKTKRRKTIAAIDSAIKALDKAKPSQQERKIKRRITNAK